MTHPTDIVHATRHVCAFMTPAEIDAMRTGAADLAFDRWRDTGHERSRDYWLGAVDGALPGRELPSQFDDEYLAGFHQYGTPAAHTQIYRRYAILQFCITWKQKNGEWCRERGGMVYARQIPDTH